MEEVKTRDVRPRKAGGRRSSLDAIRTIGILAIVMGHLNTFGYGTYFESLWGRGNYIFFALAGFAAAAPWESGAEKKFTSPKYIAGYYFKRFYRIMPMYAAATLFRKIIEPNISIADQILFINPNGPAWFLTHVMLFYLLCPVFMLTIYGIKKLTKCDDGVIGLLLLGLWLIDRKYAFLNITRWLDIIAMDVLSPFRIDFILIGLVTGYLAKSDFVNRFRGRNAAAFAIDGVSFVLLLFLMFGVPSNENICMTAVALAIFFVYIGNPGSPLQRFLSLPPVTLCGRYSLGIMLLHIPLHMVIPYPESSEGLHFFLVLAASLIPSIMFDYCMDHVYVRGKCCLEQYEANHPRFASTSTVAVFIGLLTFLSFSYSVARNGEYVPSEILGFSSSDSIGRYYAKGLGGALADKSRVKDEILSVNLKVPATKAAQNGYVFELTGEFAGTQPVLSADGMDAELLVMEDGYLMAQLPEEATADGEFEVDCQFSKQSLENIYVSSFRADSAAPYNPGDILSFTAPDYTANACFISGLESAEKTGTWAGDSARARFILPEYAVGQDLRLNINWNAVDTHEQTMTVMCDGAELMSHCFHWETSAIIFIPGEHVKNNVLILDFLFPDACPYSFGFSGMSLSLASEAEYVPGSMLSFHKLNPSGNNYFIYGLGPAEARASWAKETARAEFPLPEDAIGRDLKLWLKWAAVDTHEQTMIVSCGGAELYRELMPGEGEVEIDIPAAANTEKLLCLDFMFPDACPSSLAIAGMRISLEEG